MSLHIEKQDDRLKLKMKPMLKDSEICIRKIKTQINSHFMFEMKKSAFAYLYFIFRKCSMEYCALFPFPMYTWSSSDIWPLQYGKLCVAALTNSIYLNENMS